MARTKHSDQPWPVKHCAVCGVQLVRNRYASGRLEKRNYFLKRQTCGRACADAFRTGKVRTLDSRMTLSRRAREHLKDACEWCGTTQQLEAHHRDGDRTNNDPANVKTLCKPCHLQLHGVQMAKAA